MTKGEIISGTPSAERARPGLSLALKKIPVAGEIKERMIADPFKVTVEGCALLLSMHGVVGGIDKE